MLASSDCGQRLAVIHHYLTVKQCAIQSTNQALAPQALPCAVQWRDGWGEPSLSSPQAYDEWSPLIDGLLQTWLHHSIPFHSSPGPAPNSPLSQSRYFLISLKLGKTKQYKNNEQLADYSWSDRDLVSEFISKYMSLIVLKLWFLQADFEQIYQKHVSCPSWQAFPASGHQIFRANFKIGGQTGNR